MWAKIIYRANGQSDDYEVYWADSNRQLYKLMNGNLEEINLDYHVVRHLKDDLFLAMKDDGYCGIVNDKNKIIIPLQYEYINYLSEHYLKIGTFNNDKIGDSSRETFYSTGYISSETYDSNFAPYWASMKYGVIDFFNNEIIPIGYDIISLIDGDDHTVTHFSHQINSEKYLKVGTWEGEYKTEYGFNGWTGQTRRYNYSIFRAEDSPYYEAKQLLQFKDVCDKNYFADSVIWAIENNITQGTSATTFSPYDTCTRGQVVTFLWRAMGEPSPVSTKNIFTDIKSTDYYYNAVLWAVEQGITNGVGNNKFNPDGSITRGQMITFLWRAKGKPNNTGGAWYESAENWAKVNNILSGTSETYSTNVDCPRSDVVYYMYRNANIQQ